jgi:hypothetical protein
MERIIHLCLAGMGQNAKPNSWNRGGQKAELNSQEWGQDTMLSCPSLMGEGLSWHTISGSGATQLLSGEISNIFDHLGESCNELKSEQSKSSIAICSMGRRDQQLFINQLLVGPLQRTCLHQMVHHTKETLGSNTLIQHPRKAV